MSVNLGIEFVDAPPVKPRSVSGSPGRPSIFGPILEQLRAYPGRWARITKTSLDVGSNAKTSRAASVASKIRNGLGSSFAAGEFEATDQDGHVYVSYVGEAGIAKATEAAAARAEAKAKRDAATAAKGIPAVEDAGDEDESEAAHSAVLSPQLSAPSGW